MTKQARRSVRMEKFIPSDIDLYPCYPGGLAQVIFCGLSNGLYRVCIWGADDRGYDFDQPSRLIALETFKSLKRLKECPVKTKWPGWVYA